MNRIQLRLKDAHHDGVERKVQLSLSTFDIPRDATAEVDRAQGIVIFRFRYVDNEPARTRAVTDDISLDLGRHSGKLLAVRINAKRYRSGEMRVTFPQMIDGVDRALGKCIRETKVFNQRKNYEIVKSVIDENRPELEAAMA